MKKMHKRFTIDPSQSEQYKKLPNINQFEFSTKLNDLLDKISIQNRYATRISHCNMKNLAQLQQAKSQLNKIAENKKMQALKSMDTNDMIEQMSNRVKDSQAELQKLFKEIIDAKKQIKQLKKIINDLQNANLLLQRQVLDAKRQKFHEVVAARQQIDSHLLTTHLSNYLLESSNPSTLLYQFCFNAHKTGMYQNFFKDLDIKIEKEVKFKSRSHSKYGQQSINTSKFKIKIPKAALNSVNKIYERYKTEHCERLFQDEK